MKTILLSFLLVACASVYASSIPKGYCSVVVCSKDNVCHNTIVEQNKGKKGVALRNQVVYDSKGKKKKVTLKVDRVIKCNK